MMGVMYHPPSGPVKLMNGFFSWLASIGVTPSDTVQIEVAGRRSGKTRMNAVTSIEHGGHRYLVAPRGTTEWVRNVRAAGGEAAIRHRGRKRVRLHEVPVEERAPIIQSYLKKTQRVTKREFGVEPDAGIEEFQRIAPDHPVFRIEELD
jgi:deazaflavin-dependent oxidoreductase (nitroreductase family)